MLGGDLRRAADVGEQDGGEGALLTPVHDGPGHEPLDRLQVGLEAVAEGDRVAARQFDEVGVGDVLGEVARVPGVHREGGGAVEDQR